MGAPQGGDRVIEIGIGSANGIKEATHQNKVELDPGVPVATLAAIEGPIHRH
jgi:hypothetical protein